MNIQGCIVAGNEQELNSIAAFIVNEQYIIPCNSYTLYGIDFNITPQLLIALQTILPNINKVDCAYNTNQYAVIYATNTQLNWVQKNSTQFAFIINNNGLAITNGLLFDTNATPNNNAIAFETVLKKELKIYVSGLAKGNSDLEVMQTAIQLRSYVHKFINEGRACFSEVIKNQHDDKTLTEIVNYYAQKTNSNLVLLQRSNKLMLELLFNKQYHILLY
ncbi:MAG: hypothetical protein H7331_11105 [Bacteroidia bacterium]|nr:hypothetical protein [Bacteroidia bacterium]